MRRGIVIFRNDLRLDDNPVLKTVAANCDELLCLYVLDERFEQTNAFGLISLGDKRKTFLNESLTALNKSLSHLGQKLYVVSGSFNNVVSATIAKVKPSIVGMATHAGSYELTDEQALAALCQDNHIDYITETAECLYEIKALPFSLENMPNVFSPFRRKVEKYAEVRAPILPPVSLPAQVKDVELGAVGLEAQTRDHNPQKYALIGGEPRAREQLNYYLYESNNIKSYKETRNGLDGWDFSSKLSSWLSLGCISAARVAHEINRYETNVFKNESTYWLFFELLWRDFFHWQLHKHQSTFFTFGGIQQQLPTTQFDAERFEQWCTGNTGYPIVDACMRQLNKTGFMSNRGRQLVASCFVHELALDWRYGAAYFEQQLVDYDVASNWGNWQYLAGVGSDPRGHRQFNLVKQTQQYDPNGDFISTWS